MPKHRVENRLNTDTALACENIRFSSLFVAETRETSSATKSEEKRVFSQANTADFNHIHNRFRILMGASI